MIWKKKQKQRFVIACKEIGYGEEQRHAILSMLPHAITSSKPHPSSTSPRLNQADFEQAMAVVESMTPGNRIKGFDALHFAKKADDYLGNMRRKAGAIAGRLEAAGQLEPGGVGLSGWISKRVTGGGTDRLDQLNYNELYNLIEGLKKYARRNSVRID